uniref:T-box domain-containing protein n=1 Tax=Schistosoma mansoni TaxID=6183 RepID=A0A5K4F982_SCHMA
MELHYPSAYSTPTTLNNLQINDHSKITSVNNTTSINPFNDNLNLIPLSSSSSLSSSASSPPLSSLSSSSLLLSSLSSSELPYHHNIYSLKQYQNNDMNTIGTLSNILIPEGEDEGEEDEEEHHGTMKQLNLFDFGESSSSIETNHNNNLSNYFNQSNEYTTHTDWFSQLLQTTATTTTSITPPPTTTTTPPPVTNLLSSEFTSTQNCISPSWKNNDYVHYSYSNYSTDMNIQQHHHHHHPQQQQADYQQTGQVTFQQFQDIQYDQSNQQTFNIDQYDITYYNPIQPLDTTYITTINNNNNEISNHYNKDNNSNNNMLMKLHQSISPIQYNEQTILYPSIYDHNDPYHDHDHHHHDRDHHDHPEHFYCDLCSLNNSYPFMIKSNFNLNQSINQLNWINHSQILLNNQLNSINNNNQYFQGNLYYPSYNQYINNNNNNNNNNNQYKQLIIQKKKQYKKYLNYETNYKTRIKSIIPPPSTPPPLPQQQQPTPSPQQQQQQLKTPSTTTTKLTTLFHITNEQLSSLLPLITCNEIYDILYKYNPPNTMAQFQTICIHNNNNNDKQNQIYFRLKEQKIWSDIYLHNTEMIATNTGRRIFPSLTVDVFGLNPTDEYIFLLDMLLIQPHIFKHQGDRWIISSQSEVLNNNQTLEGKYYIQEESPKTGAYWMESGVNFTRVKITNTKEIKPNKNMIHVNSMHYYIPRISVVRLNNSMNNQSNCYHSSNQLELIGSYIIPGTQFYTVTAYQNPDVIRIKINNNPFAKGFRNRQDTDDFNDLTVLSVMNSRNKYMTTSTSSSSSPSSLSVVPLISSSQYTHKNYSTETYQC